MPYVIQRLVQQVKPDKWDALDAIDKKFDKAEAKYGFPPKRRYRTICGSGDSNTVIVEHEWKSMAAAEEATMKTMGDPEIIKLGAELNTIIEKAAVELYMV